MKVNFKDLDNTVDTPILKYCRQLIEEGVDPNTELEVYRERLTPDITIHNIGEAAKLDVKNEKFVKYIPRPVLEGL